MKGEHALELSDVERGQVISTITSQGWKIIQEKIIEAEAEKFITALLNVKPGNKEEVLERFALAKAAAQLASGIVQRLNVEMELYRVSEKGNVIPDITEDVLDLGDSVDNQEEMF